MLYIEIENGVPTCIRDKEGGHMLCALGSDYTPFPQRQEHVDIQARGITRLDGHFTSAELRTLAGIMDKLEAAEQSY